MEAMSLRAAFAALWDEVKEWVEAPSWDEGSDIFFGVGRLVAGIFGKVYVHVPGDRLHVEKINMRMVEYGCIRSKRFLVNGECCNK